LKYRFIFIIGALAGLADISKCLSREIVDQIPVFITLGTDILVFVILFTVLD
jgi:hypothetical protein